MIRNLKVLVLAVVAVAAMTSSARAAEFHSDLSQTLITSTADGTGKNSHHVFDGAGGSLTCTGGSFSGTQVGKTVSSLTLEPTYSGCTFLGQAVTVNANGCDLVWQASGAVDVVSKPGKNCATEPTTFEVAAPSCKVETGPQTGLKEKTFANVKSGANDVITTTTGLASVSYTAVGAGCPETGAKTNGAYTTGNVTLTGADPAIPSNMTNISWK